MAKLVRVRVSPQGEVTIGTEGFAGETCRLASAPFEAAIGVPEQETLTDEFYAAQDSTSTDVSEQA